MSTKDKTMKAFAVKPTAAKPTIIVRTDDTVEVLTFASKRAADKKILSLIAAGYKFDATHATVGAQ